MGRNRVMLLKKRERVVKISLPLLIMRLMLRLTVEKSTDGWPGSTDS